MALGTQFHCVLSGAQAGSEWALTALYKDLNPQLLGYLRAQAGLEADDLAADVWVDAARNISGFTGNEADFRSWFFTIAHRRLLDLHRRTARSREELRPVETFADEAFASQRIEDASEREALDMLAALPPLHAEIILLRVVCGFDSNEVARILGKKPGTVRVLQKRALERLAVLLSETGVVTR